MVRSVGASGQVRVPGFPDYRMLGERRSGNSEAMDDGASWRGVGVSRMKGNIKKLYDVAAGESGRCSSGDKTTGGSR